MKIPARAVLFDLDGTLVDPAGAITGGIRHALLRNGVPDPGHKHLLTLVGPPLAQGLLTIPGMTRDLLPTVIADYRAEYAAHGMSASLVYPGIEDLLGRLRASGARLAVATSKPRGIAMRLLAVQGLLDRFDAVRGSHDDETGGQLPGPSKAHIVGSALEAVGADRARTVMVGDRHYDVEGAQAHGIPCIGVSWGFAPDGELQKAGAVAVVDTAEELGDMLLGDGDGGAEGTDKTTERAH